MEVIAREYTFTLSRPSVPAGEVILQFINRGEDPHNMNLAEPGGEGQAGAVPNTPAGTLRDLHVRMSPGSYTLFCSLPEHERLGMRATLTVE